MPLVSVLMAIHNDAEYLPEALDSILGQSHETMELVVIDDGGTDASPDIIKRAMERDARIRYHRNDANLGLAASLNRGIREARGEFIARQDPDDLSHPDRLAREVAFLEKNPDIDIVGTGTRCMDRDGRFCYDLPLPVYRDEEVLSHLLEGRMLYSHGSVMFRRRFLETTGDYNENFIYGQDGELWLRGARAGCRFGFISDFLYSFRLKPVESTRKRVAQLYLKRKRIEAYHTGKYPIVIDKREMLAHMDREGRDIPHAMAGYYFWLAIMVIKRRRFSLGAWHYLARSLGYPDAWYRHIAKLPFFILALCPFTITRRFTREGKGAY